MTARSSNTINLGINLVELPLWFVYKPFSEAFLAYCSHAGRIWNWGSANVMNNNPPQLMKSNLDISSSSQVMKSTDVSASLQVIKGDNSNGYTPKNVNTQKQGQSRRKAKANNKQYRDDFSSQLENQISQGRQVVGTSKKNKSPSTISWISNLIRIWRSTRQTIVKVANAETAATKAIDNTNLHLQRFIYRAWRL